jgi:hypothetical protein
MTDGATDLKTDAPADDAGALLDPAAPAADTPPAGDPPAGDPPVDDRPPAPPAGDDWRTAFATDGDKLDPDVLKFLGRYHSPAAAIKAWKQNNDAIATGQYIKPLGDGASEEEVAAFRKQFGVPDKPEGYLEKLADGLTIGDDDKPFVEKFLSNMHSKNAPPEAVNAALDTYYGLVAEQEAEKADMIGNAKVNAEEELRQEWGPEYRRNLTAAHNYLSTLPETAQNIFKHGLMPDGTPIGYHADALRWLTGLALEANPLATVVPGAGSNQAQAISSEMADLTKMMGDPTSDYWKGPKSDQLQSRFRELAAAQEKLQR